MGVRFPRHNDRAQYGKNNNNQFRNDGPKQRIETSFPRTYENHRWDKKKYNKELICFRCCQLGHYSVDCPHAPLGQASNQGETLTSKDPDG